MRREDLLAAVEREAAAFTAVLETADLAAPVPACPDWDLTELAAHLAGTHRWARNAVVDGELRRDPTPSLDRRETVVAWYRDSADRLLAALRGTPAGTPCPSFAGPVSTVDFWVRRQAHELAVHRHDAEQAAGTPAPLEPELSADGIAEVLEVMVPRMRQRGVLGPLPAAVRLEQSDGEGHWVVGDGEPVATARAEAAALLLLLWGRAGLDDVELSGDVAAARAVLSAPLTP